MMGSSTRWWWCIPMFMAASCAVDADNNVNGQSALEGQVCGFEVLPSPQTLPGSACDMGRTVYGPVRVERERGKPTVTSAAFETTTAGEACVSVRSGEDGEGRISSGRVSLDGESFALPSDFNQKSDGLEGEVTLAAGTHSLDVEVASGPGSFVEVEVREPYETLTSQTETVGPNGALRVTNVATDHPLMTPNGDGHHDDTVFNVDGEPLIELPGKDDGTTDYFLDWTFFLVDLDDCSTEETAISGRTLINSPTNVQTTWDGTLSDGTTVDSGNYAYYVEVSLVREDGLVLDTVESPRFGMIIDSEPADYDEQPAYAGLCDPVADPFNCRCPGAGGLPTNDSNCTFADPHPGHGNLVRLDDPSAIDRSFITTTQGDDGRWHVVADMSQFNEGGFVVKTLGDWDSAEELRDWVAEMSGVPAGETDSLFNFDFVQIGTSTGLVAEADPANPTALAAHSFNQFFLDAITDEEGNITVAGETTNLAALFDDDAAAPEHYEVLEARVDDECTESGNLSGDGSLRSKFCAYNTAVPITESLGVYALRTTLFDVDIDGATTTRDELCVTNAIFSCGVRTFSVAAEQFDVDASYYVATAEGPQFAFGDSYAASDATALSVSHDRGAGADGVCARAVATQGGLLVRMDSADGAVPSTCVTNGIFP